MNPYSGADSFPDPINVLADSDVPVAANWNPGFEGLADRTRWLKDRTGIGRLQSQAHEDVPTDYAGSPDNPSTWPISWSDVIFTPANTVTLFTIPHSLLKVNDLVEIDVRGTMGIEISTGSLTAGDIDFGYVANGGSYTGMGRVRLRNYNGAGTTKCFFAPFSVCALIDVTDPTHDILIQAQGRVNPGTNVGIDGSRDQFFRIWSAN